MATAETAGISEKALRNLEAGHGSTVETLLRFLKALDALDGIDILAPEPLMNPTILLRTPSPAAAGSSAARPKKTNESEATQSSEIFYRLECWRHRKAATQRMVMLQGGLIPVQA